MERGDVEAGGCEMELGWGEMMVMELAWGEMRLEGGVGGCMLPGVYVRLRVEIS